MTSGDSGPLDGPAAENTNGLATPAGGLDGIEASISPAAFPVPERPGRHEEERKLGDFTTSPKILKLVPLAIGIGVLSAAVSLALLIMIGFCTNLLYYGKIDIHLASPNANTLGLIAVVIPIGGGLIVGLMARFGSEQIRGHGIPEAMENILINGSQVQPRLAILKPISSAISIGTGGPFGAEGPIILTGGAVASIVGQLFRLTAAQRRSLLVAGASAGMSAVFGTPVAATLFGVELLVFEFKPRSMVLIGLASATADGLRIAMQHAGLVSPQPLFAIPEHAQMDGVALLGAAAIGIVVGLAAWVMTVACYGAEDLFAKLNGHLHWMWWPTIGGLVIGLGGLLDPRALGVGYNTIHAELLDKLGIGALLLLAAVKLVIWAVGLGSGTSGGILAPLLMMGAAIGGVMGHVLPGAPPGVWAMIGMSGALAGVTRSPFTSIVFAFELTHDTGSLLPLLITCTIANLISTFVLKRSILTEKVARRGFHVMREYQVEPMEALFVREAMQQDVLTVDPEEPIALLATGIAARPAGRRQRLYPVTDGGNRVVGVIAPSDLLSAVGDVSETPRVVRDIMRQDVLVTYPDEILRAAADQMAELCVGALPVVTRETGQLLGVLTEFDLLKARQRQLSEERHRERVLRLRRLSPPAQPEEVAVSTPGVDPAALNVMTPAPAPTAWANGTHDPRQPGLLLAEPGGQPTEPEEAREQAGGSGQHGDNSRQREGR